MLTFYSTKDEVPIPTSSRCWPGFPVWWHLHPSPLRGTRLEATRLRAPPPNTHLPPAKPALNRIKINRRSPRLAIVGGVPETVCHFFLPCGISLPVIRTDLNPCRQSVWAPVYSTFSCNIYIYIYVLIGAGFILSISSC